MNTSRRKTVLITGAAGGLAHDALKKIHREGYRVIGIDRHQEKLSALQKQGALDAFLAGDLTCPQFQKDIIHHFRSEVDILINNVGGGFSKGLEETSREDFLNLWKLNFETAAMLTQGFISRMKKNRWGKIINISTVLAEHPLPNLCAYAASKAALIAFTKSIALQYAPYHINANVIAPGYIENPKHQSYFSSPEGESFMKRFMPSGQLGPVDAISGTLLFLLSENSRQITGQVIKVDGGYSIW